MDQSPRRTISAAERAFAVSSASGDSPLAALTALDLAAYHSHQLAESISRGWTRRAERLLQDAPECAAHGHLARLRSNKYLGQGDMEQAFNEATAALDIGTRLGDRDLQALGLHQQGVVLVAQGKADEGLALLEEAAVPAVSGELDPSSTATIYDVISTCRDLADYRRAGEWTEAAKRWCERRRSPGFPDIAGLIGQRSCGCAALGRRPRTRCSARARSSARILRCLRAKDLSNLARYACAWATVTAREAFQMAEGLGATPQPGLAMLDLAEGNMGAAAAGVRGALEENAWDRLRRARLLPARVDHRTRCRRHGDRSRLGR